MDKIRAVAYCRVSLDKDDQINSLENQKQFWEEYIRNNPDMVFCGIYADEGITGTSVKKRSEFKRMIRDASDGKFDFIMTKEVSRFARNVVDCLTYTRRLKKLGIGVIFQNDNINTMDKDGELRLSLMATLAQEESRKTSERVKWGHKQAMKKGIPYGNNVVLGYDLRNKTFTIIEEEAEIIRKVYRWFLEGESLWGIVRRLNDIGFTKGRLGGKLTNNTIKRILTNEKYMGDLVQGKYISEDYLTQKQIPNPGARIVNKDVVPAIIGKETWYQVQDKLKSRSYKYKEEGIGYQRTAWGGKLVCGACGSRYRRKQYKNKDGSARIVWRCMEHYNHGSKGCPNTSYIREERLEQIFTEVFKKLVSDKSRHEIIENFKRSLEKAIDTPDTGREIDLVKKQLAQIIHKKDKLLDLFMDDALSKEVFKQKNDQLENSETELRATLEALENRNFIIRDKIAKLENLYRLLTIEGEFLEYRKELVDEYLESISVNDKNMKIILTIAEYDVDLEKYPKMYRRRIHNDSLVETMGLGTVSGLSAMAQVKPPGGQEIAGEKTK